jgi:hypothetical protein
MRELTRRKPRARWVLRALSASLLAVAVLSPVASAQQPAPAAAGVIDGPNADIVRPSGLAMSIARDGTGGLVYLKRVSGVVHVFASSLAGGSFQAPVQLDSGLSGPASQPVIAAGEDGLLLIGFINGGALYVVSRPDANSPLSAPGGIAGNAQNPSISISDFGKAYLAFTVADGGGYDVRTAYYYNGRWALEAPPLNATPADSAGTGSGRPQVATGGDGVGVVVWGESGHVYSRRVWGTSPSVALEQADAPPAGCTEGSADEPVVGTLGDSSYAQVAFHELVTCGGHPLSRVLVNRLHGSVYDGVAQPDGLAGSSSGGADGPQIAMGEYGEGWVVSTRTTSNDIFATAMGDRGVLEGTTQVNGIANAAPPDPVPSMAGLYSTLIAWQQYPGAAGVPEIRVRYAPDGSTLGPEVVVSTPTQGPTDAGNGLAVAGDVSGDAAVAWLQDPAGASELAVEQMYQGPGPFSARKSTLYQRSSYPVLSWTAAHELWGPMTYTVSVDGNQVAQTQATAVRVPSAVFDGPHSWQATGANVAGQQSRARPSTVFIDTVPPVASVALSGHPEVGSTLRAYINYVDLPPAGEPPSDASGVAKVTVGWGDGKPAPLTLGYHRAVHVYRRTGRYRITVLVTDKAGNTARSVTSVRVQKPKTKKKGK